MKVNSNQAGKHSWVFLKERNDERDGQVHQLFKCRHCGLYRRALKGNVHFGFATVYHYLRKGEVFPDGLPKWLKDRPGCGEAAPAWALVRRVVVDGVPWDEFVSASGEVLKRESREGFNSKGQLWGHPMRQYARASVPEAWFDRIRDIV